MTGILVGTALDPYKIDADNLMILRSWLSGANSLDETIAGTYPCSGRWVLFLSSPVYEIILPDAGANYEVVWTLDSSGKKWAATSTKLLAAHTHLDGDEEFREKIFTRFVPSMQTVGLGLPLDRTVYKDTFTLLPNHLLDLQTMTAKRFWPNNPIPIRSVEETANEAANMLRCIVAAASRRCPIAITISATYIV